ncbi:MAG TPA: PAS domain S-box protein, partial [Planctomycetaceae bacterium]|nr:PAS domain S-box protein [Planctomycetaceae bacterium]
MSRESSDLEVDVVWAHSREGWLRVDWPSGLVRSVNPKGCELCGRASEQIVGRPFWNLFEPESVERLREWIAGWQRGGEFSARAGVWLHRVDGASVPITVRVFRPEMPDSRQCLVALDDLRDLQSLVARLDQAEARLDETERVARLGWWEWDIQRDVLLWSEALPQVIGIPVNEFGGTMAAFVQGVHPDDRAHVQERLDATLTRGEPYVVGFRVVRKDGSIRHMHMQGRVGRDDDDGRPLRLYGTCQDVTDRAMALIELRESEQKYRDLVETSNELIWSVDEQGRFTYVNQAIREVYGYRPEEVLGEPFTMLLPPEQIPIDWQAFEKVLAGQPLFNYETVHLRKDGRRINLSFNAIAKLDAKGQVIGTTGTAIDITERQRHEQLLRERESWFRAIFENAPQCLMILSVDGQLLDINPTGLTILEADSAAPLIGRELQNLLAPQSRGSFAKVLEGVRSGSARSCQAQIHGAKGTRRWLEGQLVPLRDAEGHVIRLLAEIQDVTARRKADAFREGEQQVLEEIASGQELHQVLRTLIKLIEQQLYGALCAVMLLEEDELRLRVAASSPMPEDVRRRISSVRVVPGAPSFADAVATGQRRIVDDTTTEPSWLELRTLADRFQLRSCWAQPIRGFSHDVLGVLSIFFLWPRSPTAEELQLLDTGAYLAGIAIHRTRAEQALRDSEKRFRTLFEHSPDAIFVESLTGIVLDVNPAACVLHGLSRAELIGRHVMELVPPSCHDDVRRDFPKLASGELRQLEGMSWHPVRGEIPVSLHVSKTEYAFQPALLLHVRDISERKQAEAKAREAQSQLAHIGRLSLMGELMAGISHEINQPLFAIANFANACEKTLLD